MGWWDDRYLGSFDADGQWVYGLEFALGDTVRRYGAPSEPLGAVVRIEWSRQERGAARVVLSTGDCLPPGELRLYHDPDRRTARQRIGRARRDWLAACQREHQLADDLEAASVRRQEASDALSRLELQYPEVRLPRSAHYRTRSADYFRGEPGQTLGEMLYGST